MGIQLSDWLENTVEKGKLLVKINFSFSHYVFKSCLLLMRQNEYLWSEDFKFEGLPAYSPFPILFSRAILLSDNDLWRDI